jgi:hypothetical protein
MSRGKDARCQQADEASQHGPAAAPLAICLNSYGDT